MYRATFQRKKKTSQQLSFLFSLTGALLTASLFSTTDSHAVIAPGPMLVDESGQFIAEPDKNRNANIREVLIKFKRGVGNSERQNALRGIASQRRDLGRNNAQNNPGRAMAVLDQLSHARLADNIGLKQALDRLNKNPNIIYAEPNYEVDVLATPNDTDFSELWGLSNQGQTGGTIGADINAGAAWDISTGSKDVVVAVIDTGIEYTHPDLAANIWVNADEISGNGIDDDNNGYIDDIHGYDFFNNDSDPIDDNFHGTHCAGTIGAVGNNNQGVVGVNWNVQLMAVKFLGASGSGSVSAAISAIAYATDNGADVLSNSWGGGGYSQALQDVITAATEAGVLFVAAAGNAGTDNLVYPAALQHVLAVSATDHKDVKATFSSYGAFVDIGAPGVSIHSTKLNGSYGPASGTSMATPHVAGAAAMLLSIDPTLGPIELEAILETSAEDLGDPGWDTHFGSGRLELNAALQRAGAVDTAMPVAQLAYPIQGEILAGNSIQIMGSASGAGFSDFSLDYRAKGSTIWHNIDSGGLSVDNGTLAIWDTSSLPDNDYLVRLSVTDAAGNTAYDTLEVTVDNFNARIVFPTHLVSQGAVQISGHAQTLGGLAFGNYTLQWGEGSSPTSYSSSGVSLVNSGTQAVDSGLLATWDTSLLNHDGIYTLKLTVNSAEGTQALSTVQVRVDANLKTGWPRLVDFDTAPTIADLDGDGDREIVLAGRYTDRVQVLNHLGKPVPGFPASLASDVINLGGEGHAVVSDVDGDASQEILVTAYRKDSLGYFHSLFLLSANGSPYAGWVAPRFSRKPLVPIVIDINADGSQEIVTFEITRWSAGYSDYKFHAFDLSGTPLPGYPVKVSIDDIRGGARYFSAHDLDSDGLPEFAMTQNEKVLLFDHTGNLKPAWPQLISPDQHGDRLIWFDGVVGSADITGDGQHELVATSSKSCSLIDQKYYYCTVGKYSTIYAWHANGQTVSGFPRTTDTDGFVSWYNNAPAFVDLDKDGVSEIVAGVSPFMIFNGNGQIVAQNSLSQRGSSGVVDIDGDGNREFVSGKTNLKIFTSDGTVLWNARIYQDYHYAGILVDDLDGDNQADIIKAASAVNPDINRVDPDYFHLYVWNSGTAGFNGSAWPMLGGNQNRSGHGSTGEDPGTPPKDTVAPVISITSPADGDTLSGEIVITADATDAGGIANVTFSLDGNTYVDNTAPYSWSATSTAGEKTIVATATDTAGNAGTASITITVQDAGVPDNTPPTLTLTNPTDGEVLSGEFTISADATDAGGVASVTFSIAGQDYTDTSAPYAWVVSPPAGEHLIFATARDMAGNTETATIIVTVESAPPGEDTTPPEVQITSPEDGATIKGNGQITVTVDAHDADSGIYWVEFGVDGNLNCTSGSAPYRCDLHIPTGNHEIAVKAVDNAGNHNTKTIRVTRNKNNGGKKK